jgi:outer membrane lipoprotein SlyB
VKVKAVLVVLIAAIVSGCATNRGTGASYNPIVDRPGANYIQDLADCQAHATKVQGAADSAVAGAMAGALFGALLSAAVGGGRHRDNYMAAGALSGATSAATAAEGGQRGIITRCLTGRGHMVLQ